MMFFKRIRWAARYAALAVRHKIFVFRAGLKVGAPIHLLLLHDLSKFGPSELFAYGRQFFGDQGAPLEFSYAWMHHQKANKHHWESWIPITGHNRGGYKDLEPLPMPERYVKEMVADFIGASMAYSADGAWPTADNWPWLRDNFYKVYKHLHWRTRELTVYLLRRYLGVRDLTPYIRQPVGDVVENILNLRPPMLLGPSEISFSKPLSWKAVPDESKLPIRDLARAGCILNAWEWPEKYLGPKPIGWDDATTKGPDDDFRSMANRHILLIHPIVEAVEQHVPHRLHLEVWNTEPGIRNKGGPHGMTKQQFDEWYDEHYPPTPEEAYERGVVKACADMVEAQFLGPKIKKH